MTFYHYFYVKNVFSLFASIFSVYHVVRISSTHICSSPTKWKVCTKYVRHMFLLYVYTQCIYKKSMVEQCLIKICEANFMRIFSRPIRNYEWLCQNRISYICLYQSGGFVQWLIPFFSFFLSVIFTWKMRTTALVQFLYMEYCEDSMSIIHKI